MSTTPGDGTPERPVPTGSEPGSGYTYPSASGTPGANEGTAASSSTAGVPEGTRPVELTDEPQPKKSARKGLLVGGLAAVVVLGSAGAFAASKLSGGGAQPADVLPADTFLYARVDIDPSAGQKIAAVRFFDKLPKLKESVEKDWRKELWNKAVQEDSSGCLAAMSYDNDIAPWLGDRLGFGMRPGGTKDKPNVVVAMQVKDEGAAKTGTDKLLDCASKSGSGASTDMEVSFKDGYALLTPAGNGAATVAAVEKGNLSSDADFSSDLNALGEQGVASYWADTEPMINALADMEDTGADSASLDMVRDFVTKYGGRTAAAVRFDASYAELAGIGRGMTGLPDVKGDAAGLTQLPADTLGAVSIGGGNQIVKAMWPDMSKLITEAVQQQGEDDPLPLIEQELGMGVDEALETVLGSSLTFAMPDQDLQQDQPAFAVKVLGTDGAKLQDLVDSVERLSGSSLGLPLSIDGDKAYLGSDQSAMDALKQAGTLGDEASFKTAVGDATGLVMGAYVNLDKIEKLYLDQIEDADARTAVESMSAIGLNQRMTGANETAFTYRIVAN